MFENIGVKIKIFSKIVSYVGIGASLIVGLNIMNMANDNRGMVMGFAVIILGALLSWISSFISYGFGQLVENSDILVSDLKGKSYTER